MKKKIEKSLLSTSVVAFIFILVIGLFLTESPKKVFAADNSITITTVELTVTDDADNNHYANIGDTINVAVSLDNTDDNPTACVSTTTVVTVDLRAYGWGAVEALPCVSADGANGLDFEGAFVIQNAPVFGLQDIAPNNPASAVTVTAGDADELAPLPTMVSNNLGDGVIDTITTVGVDTVAPTIINAHIESNNAISPTILAKAGDTVTLSFDSSETLSIPPTVSFSSGGVVVNNGGNPIAVVNGGGNSWSATYIVEPTDTEGAVTFSISGYVDLADNAGAAKTTVDDASTMTIDLTPPPLISITAKTQSWNLPHSNSALWYNYPGDTFEAFVGSNENIDEVRVCIKSLTGVDPTAVCSDTDFNNSAYYMSGKNAGDATDYSFTGNSFEGIAGHSLVDMAGYTMNVELIDKAGNVNVVSNPAQAFVMVWNIDPKVLDPSLNNAGTTDWSIIDDFTDVTGLTFRAEDTGTLLGELSFPGSVNLTDPATVTALQSFSTNVVVGGGDLADGSADIGINAAALAALNQPADLTIAVPAATSQPGMVVYDDAGVACGYVANYATDVTVCGDDVSSITWNAGPHTLTFSTSGFSNFGADSIPPSVVTYSPANGATGLAIDANLMLTFDQNVYAGTGNVVIKKSSDDSVVETIDITSGQVVFDGTTGITINPAMSLLNGTSYYVEIDNTAITDEVGNAYAGIADKTTWAFTTVRAAGGGSGSMVSGPSTKTEIPGCGDRITGFSVATGVSCTTNVPHNEQAVSNEQVPGTPGFQFTLLLKLGSKGDEVVELQKFLNAAPYNNGLVPDGKFGPKTKAALIKFQLANGLAGDGIAGPMTRAVLNK